MDQARWRQIEEVFHSAIEIEESDRPAFLRNVCGDDDELLAEVESLLPEYEETDSFLGESRVNAGLALIGAQGEFEPGSRVDEYEVRQLIARGGTGNVYLAVDTELGRQVALKVLGPEVLAGNTEGTGRFEREVRAAASISHPNVAHLYGAGRFEGRNYLAMEYVEGVSLRQMLKAGTLEPERAVETACQVAKALSAAHKKGIIHRDIKPENIVVCDDGLVKVLDFGLAKITGTSRLLGSLTGDVSFRTPPGLVMGTIGYMSPEQVRGREVDERTDIWSLGVVLFEMLAGRRPFQGDSETDTLTSILTDEPEPPLDLGSGLHSQATRIIQKCLAKDPADRFESASDLALVLRALLSDLKSVRPVERQIAKTEPPAGGAWSGVGVALWAAGAAVAAAALYFLLTRSP